MVTQQKTEAGKSDGHNIVRVKRTAGSSSNPTYKEKTAISFHLGVVCIVSVCVCVCVCVCVLSRFSHVQLFATLWTVAHQVPLYSGIL